MGRHRQFIDATDVRRKGAMSEWNTIRAMCLILLCTCTASWLSAQQTDAAASGAIRALEHEWVEAQSHNDNRALNLILDNNVVYVEYGRLVTKADYLLRIKHQDASTDEVVMEPITVRVFGNTAIVTGSYRETQRQGGIRKFTRWRFVDTWAYKEHSWVLIAAGSAPIHD
ncbi:MAG TPA: nuclear transport factor 2 family protein [Candidatus Sulfotelmatobacter sp.]|nr:nuclear transport factor 2 family protein [Candidatus Sulfotelmatobacter sp.]